MNSLLFLVVSVVFLVRQVESVGVDDEQNGLSGGSGKFQGRGFGLSTQAWCYQLDWCKQAVSASGWEHGVCKDGNRQSPIDIRIAETIAPSAKRKKRKVGLRKMRSMHGERGRSKKGIFGSMMPMYSASSMGGYSGLTKPAISESMASAEFGETDYDSSEAYGFGQGYGYENGYGSGQSYGFGSGQGTHQAVPSIVEQGILCSPQPRWNVIWVNGLPYKYWVQMNLCRLILRQRAKFIMEPPKKPKKPKPTMAPPPTPPPPRPPPIAIPDTTPAPPPPSTTPFIPQLKARKEKIGLLPQIEEAPKCQINFSGFYKNYVMKQFMLINNGATMVLDTFVSFTEIPPTFNWPEKDNAVYKLQQVHFHWGPDDSVGSEHTIDGKHYPVEMHLVHYRSTEGQHGFSSFKDAVLSGREDALAVVAVFLEPDDSITSSFMDSIVYNYASVPRTGDKMLVICENMKFNLGEGLEMASLAYHYMGSLTTPGCNEIVAWLVLKETIKVPRRDILALRGAVREEDYPLVGNYRYVT